LTLVRPNGAFPCGPFSVSPWYRGGVYLNQWSVSGEAGNVHSNEKKSLLGSFVDPVTLPHLALLIVVCSSLYALMEMGIGEFINIGSIIFLSFSISYIIAAMLNSTNLGEKVFKFEIDDGKYWRSALLATAPILAIVTIFSILAILHLDGEGKNLVSLILASLFIIMSIGQGLTLSYGGVVFARKRAVSVRKGSTENWQIGIRAGFVILVFVPVVWWYGYQAGSVQEAQISTHTKWVGFLFFSGIISIFVDTFTKKRRSLDGIDGRAVDKMILLLVLTASWHILGAWRRFLAEGPAFSMLLEEAILMGLTVILSVWSLSNKGFNRGWRIFQGRSATFWGLAFGYMYGGSIASLSALSDGNFIDVTAGGHVLTALMIIAFSPLAVSMIGPPSEIVDLKAREGETDLPPHSFITEDSGAQTKDQSIGGQLDKTTVQSDEDDVVELLD